MEATENTKNQVESKGQVDELVRLFCPGCGVDMRTHTNLGCIDALRVEIQRMQRLLLDIKDWDIEQSIGAGYSLALPGKIRARIQAELSEA